MTFPLNKRTFALALAAGTLLAASGVQAQTALDDIMKAKVLKVAVQTDSAPYGFVGTDLKPIGLDIDMANLIGKKLGVPVELVVVVDAPELYKLVVVEVVLHISNIEYLPELIHTPCQVLQQGLFPRRMVHPGEIVYLDH